MLIRVLLLVALLAAAGLRPAFSHEGHSHGEEPAPPAVAAPRAEAHSELFEIVAVLGPDRRLWLYLDRHATSEPIDGATVQVTLDGEDLGAATRAGEATYLLANPALERPGQRNLVFIITAGEDVDLLPATLEIPAAAVAPTAAPGSAELLSMALREPVLWAAGLVLLLLGIAIGRAATPRALPPLVVAEPPATATRAQGLPAGAPSPGRVAAAPAAVALLAVLLVPMIAGAQPMDAPRRQPDGSIFVPKPSQRLLGLRTGTAEPGEAAVAIPLTGRVVADPNASGRVQASEAGRIEPPEGGFPMLGQRVARGEVLGFVVPIMAAQDRVGVRASIAELDALIVIGEARVRRLTALAGTVAAREISDARADLEGLRQRRAANLPAVTGREPILAPSAGLISVVRVAAGQVIQAQEPLFDIVDPTRLWVEAIAFDPAAVAEVSGASAVTAGGEALRLGFVGRGMTLRQQGLPLHFRIESGAAGLAVGQPVTVLVETPRRTVGIVLPAQAVIRNPEGGQVVYEMPSAERFLPRPVRAQPLDGQHVLVTAGLERGARVVTSGAGLIAQVR
ncbi:efflux RND transporter periplasmic adaptor subunit [Falsiroseomonas selenitidurans]|uniref:HlyD family efflux transporter periplasmic adaptor subunit n=1 Tax=Falsiroseomonas selenitidurans TaxID=2716335 RepID=A0ABX1E1V2_9PROT|nr:HlyD family efflux transporter periplasmic adaptor subunit [Falsiroseomonas selenitidurans]NKC31130.1 HlyD family efflux transporter periplasmic adaptor subunit [Falsiroseomonas selenitidurans]